MRHFVVVGILIIVVTAALVIGLDAAHLMPVEASAQAIPIDWMWNIQVIVMCILFSIIVVPMFYSLVVFRRRKGDTSDGAHFEGNTALEIAWLSLPLVIVVVFAYLGAVNLSDTLRRDPSAMVVKVTGIQWSWKFEYPADLKSGIIVSDDELHIPVDQQVLLRMTSTDVIHSFWVPEFRVKQDLVPGRFTELVITPTLIGEYKVRCAELCGTSHAFMEKPVVIETREAYEAYLSTLVADAIEALKTPEGRGKLLVDSNGCVACHSINGAVGIGPTWFGLFGSEVELAGGAVVIADEAFITESIKDPQAQIVAGFETQQMPNYGFTDEEIAAIVAYIKTIK
jgi:cytochrome c oxidase subunit 2